MARNRRRYDNDNDNDDDVDDDDDYCDNDREEIQMVQIDNAVITTVDNNNNNNNNMNKYHDRETTTSTPKEGGAEEATATSSVGSATTTVTTTIADHCVRTTTGIMRNYHHNRYYYYRPWIVIVTTSTIIMTIMITYYTVGIATGSSLSLLSDNNPFQHDSRSSSSSSSSIHTNSNNKLHHHDQGDHHYFDIRIFCYGDSLTAGVSPPDRTILFPYATYLQSALLNTTNNDTKTEEETHQIRYKYSSVDHIGFPGWMSNELFELICHSRGDNNNNECGTRGVVTSSSSQRPSRPDIENQKHHNQVRNSILSLTNIPSSLSSEIKKKIGDSNNNNNKNSSTISPITTSTTTTVGILVYLAGTNDLGRPTRTVDDISQSIIAVHEWAKVMNDNNNDNDNSDNNHRSIMKTIALSIPSSAYQERVPEKKKKATEINRRLKNYADANAAEGFSSSSLLSTVSSTQSSSSTTTYVEFPFEYSSSISNNIDDDDDDNSNDGTENVFLWSVDGLHLSQAGYKVIGEYLASIIDKEIIHQIINDWK